MTSRSKKIVFFMILQLSIISCRGALIHKNVVGSSSRLTNNETKQMVILQFQLKAGSLISGIMLNSDTVLVKIPNKPMDVPTDAPKTLTVAGANSIYKGLKAFWIRDFKKDNFLPGIFNSIDYTNDFQIYKLERKIEGLSDIKVSELKLVNGRVSKSIKYVGPAEEGGQKTYEVEAYPWFTSIAIKIPKDAELKEGGALLDSSGSLLGIVTDKVNQPYKISTCELPFGPIIWNGRIVNDLDLNVIEEAKAGFPTHAERKIDENFRQFWQAVFSKVGLAPDIIQNDKLKYPKILFGGLDVSIELLNDKGKMTISTGKCTIIFSSYSQIYYENNESTVMDHTTVYFANRGKPNLVDSEIKALTDIKNCLNGARSWLPRDETNAVRSLAVALEAYAKEQSSGS